MITALNTKKISIFNINSYYTVTLHAFDSCNTFASS